MTSPKKSTVADQVFGLMNRSRRLPAFDKQHVNDSEHILRHCLESIDFLREEYIRKQREAAKASQKLTDVIEQEKNLQLIEVDKCLHEIKSTMAAAQEMRARYSSAQRHQEELSHRITSLLAHLNGVQPGLSKEEEHLKQQLLLLEENIEFFQNSLKEMRSRLEFQKAQREIMPAFRTEEKTESLDMELTNIQKVIQTQLTTTSDLAHRIQHIKIVGTKD